MSATKTGAEIRVGDIIRFFGSTHRVARIEPPAAATLAINPTCLGYARADDGWGITLDPLLRLEVL